MCAIQYKAGYDSSDSLSSEDRAIGDAFKKGVDSHIIDAINKANSVSIYKIIKLYKNIDESATKITCPFPSHKGGREQTPSFYIYPKTNTFWCYGCSVGRTPCDFISNMEEVGKYAAADRILKIVESEEFYQDIDTDNYQSITDDLCDFSSFIRDSIRKYPNKLAKIEEACKKFDELVLKHNLENNSDSLKSLISKIKNKLYLNLNI